MSLDTGRGHQRITRSGESVCDVSDWACLDRYRGRAGPPAGHYPEPLLFLFNSFDSDFKGSVLMTSALVSQPFRAMPAPRRRKPACSFRCASQLITHLTPLLLA